LLGSAVFIDPELLEHDMVVFAAGTQTESVRMRTRELFASEQVTTVPLVKQADQGSDDPISRWRAAQQDPGRRRTPSTVSEVANCKGGVSTPLPRLQRACVRTPNFAPTVRPDLGRQSPAQR
jgi:hypothetical protein